MKKFLFTISFIAAFQITFATVVNYPYNYTDSKLGASKYYTVELIDGDNKYQPLVYMSQSNAEQNGRNAAIVNNSISWCSFAFSESVKVRVSVKNGQSKVQNTSCTILPSRFEVVPTKINDSTVEFTINKASQYSVEFGSSGYKNGLMIFADPLETDVMDKEGSNVHVCTECDLAELNGIPTNKNSVYFDNSFHMVGPWQIPAHIKNIYFAPGAIVRTNLLMSGGGDSDVKIYGRGTLDGRGLAKENSIEAVSGANNITVNGLIISQSNEFAVRLLGSNNEIHWVKTPGGWNFNADGLVGYNNTNISHCFVWANDDGIKLYRDNQNIHDIVAWHLTNGGVFQWCWNSVDAKNIRVKDVDVLHGMWPSDGGNQGVFNIRGNSTNNGVKTQEDFIFENIKVETPVKVLFRLAPQKNHIAKNIQFINVDALVTSDVTNKIQGHDGYLLEDITFENLKMNGVCIDADNFQTVGKFNINAFTDDIVFKNTDCEDNTSAKQHITGVLHIYPNPANNVLHINTVSNARYSIVNVSGMVMQQGQLLNGDNQINIEALNAGIYIVMLQTGSGVQSEVLVKG